jgi:hypothetical protein
MDRDLVDHCARHRASNASAHRHGGGHSHRASGIDLPVLLVVIALSLITGCLVIVEVSAARLARSAINTFAIAAVLSLVALLIHVHADGQYLRRVAGQRMDEFAARLGEDWESAYLAGLAVHESSRPAPAHASPSGSTHDR